MGARDGSARYGKTNENYGTCDWTSAADDENDQYGDPRNKREFSFSEQSTRTIHQKQAKSQVREFEQHKFERLSTLNRLGPRGAHNAPRHQNSRPARSQEVNSHSSKRVGHQGESLQVSTHLQQPGPPRQSPPHRECS